MKFGQVHHIEYYVIDLQKTKDFWGWFLDKLDYSVSQEFGDGISYEHPLGTYLVFVQVKDEHLPIKNNRQGSGLNHLAFMGADQDFLTKLESDLKGKSVKILKSYEGYLCFEDSNQFAVEVYCK